MTANNINDEEVLLSASSHLAHVGSMRNHHATTRVSCRTGTKIRLRLLNNLGIVRPDAAHDHTGLLHPKLLCSKSKNAQSENDDNEQQPVPNLMKHLIDRKPFDEIILAGAKRTFVRLNDGKTIDHDDETKENASSTKNKRVQFANIASVVEIPDRDSYSNEEKSLQWTGAQALMDISRRNEKEFYFEDYDWQNVVEEDDFINIRGVLVHPAHVPKGYKSKLDAQAATLLEMQRNQKLGVQVPSS